MHIVNAYSAKNVWHGAENIPNYAKTVWHGAKNVWQGATNVWHAELLKVADVQTHICAKILSICSKLVFLNPKQVKQVLFYDFGTI